VIRISPLKALLAASALASAAVLAACHRLRSPGEQTRERWAWAVKKYGDRAHLAPEDRPAVLDYLQARAKDAAPSTETR
jgi:hypothetical protein